MHFHASEAANTRQNTTSRQPHVFTGRLFGFSLMLNMYKNGHLMLTYHKLKTKLSWQTNSVMLLLFTTWLSSNSASAAPQTTPSSPVIQQAQQGVEWNNQGFVLGQQGQYAQATALYQRALPLLQANDRRTQLNRAATLNNLGVALSHQQQLNAAAQAFSEAYSLRAYHLGPTAAPALLSQHNLAITLSGLGQTQLACQHMQAALQGRTTTLGAEHSDTQLSARLLQHIPNCTALSN